MDKASTEIALSSLRNEMRALKNDYGSEKEKLRKIQRKIWGFIPIVFIGVIVLIFVFSDKSQLSGLSRFAGFFLIVVMFSGFYILFSRRSESTKRIKSILKENAKIKNEMAKYKGISQKYDTD